MLSPSTLGALLALTNAIAAIPYDGPIATPVAKRWSPQGFTPKPTTQPKPLLEMFRRQEDPAFCGFLEGDPEASVTCRAGSSCMYDDTFSWFGCCTGTAQTDCNIITACVESTKIDDCLEESSCANDYLAIACTDSEEPYCMGLYTVISSETYGHFECAATDTTYEVVGTTSDSSPFSSARSRPSPSFSLVSSLEDESSATLTRFRISETDTATLEEEESSTEVEDEESSTTEDSAPTFTRGARTTDSTTERPSATADEAATSSSSTAGAVRTAQAVLGAAGGVAGLIAVLA